jgi:mono/diheme cytochrome c family protein
MLVVIALVIAVLAAVAAGCSEPDEEAAITPDTAETVINTAPQTDAEGNTVPTRVGEVEAGDQAEGEAEGGGGGAEGDAAAGEQVFAGTCGACHAGNGTEAGGVGPQLAGSGVNAEDIQTIVMNGRGAMPPQTTVTGADLDNVTAYVLSLQ